MPALCTSNCNVRFPFDNLNQREISVKWGGDEYPGSRKDSTEARPSEVDPADPVLSGAQCIADVERAKNRSRGYQVFPGLQ